ncbi:unnamed protein product [Blepharisma stoltei]|uniref:Receptor ligand binding region domain-containing protein n=1 Tax=Blepharisma stoltei TaxID=1481888 RepID=A0AAU9I5X1_9CILI|nr:unnamed protein product [Blepharisma stoltei]
MENYINSKVRIYVIFLAPPNHFYFFEDLYDTGLRRGDAIFIFYDRVAYAFYLETNTTQREKLKELLYGSIMITQADWVGDYGKEIKQRYIKEFSYPLDYRCFSFDAAMLLLHGIRYTINQGGNVENSTLLNTYLRNQKFTGCSGTIAIESDTNDRSTGIIGVYSMV